MKKQALGSVPMKREIKTFEETKTEGVSLANEFNNEDFLKAKQETTDDAFNQEIEKMKEVLNISDEEIKDIEDTFKEEKKPKQPSVKARLKEGYSRKTFVINDSHLELFLALAKYKNVEQKELLEALLNKAFDTIDESTKQQALKEYNKEEVNINDLFN